MPKSDSSTKKTKGKSSSTSPQLKPDKHLQEISKYIAITVRNAMENFHVAHLSDAQMKELNPIIRNAICSALYAYFNYEEYPNAKEFVDFQLRCIPAYWEEPELSPFLQRTEEKD